MGDFDKFQEEQTDARAQSELEKVRAERDRTKRALAELTDRLSVYESIDDLVVKAPKWVSPAKPRGKGARGIPNLLFSDAHLDEIVKPEELEGANAFDRHIAEIRCRRLVDNTIKVSRDYFSGLTFEGGVLYLGGDIFGGIIHEELRETNEAPLMATIVHWLEILVAFVGELVDYYSKLHVVGVVGNHGRLSRKPRAKLRAQDNADWLLYKLLAREFRADDRVTFQVGDSADTDVEVYTTRFKVTHGDQFRGGGGIAGYLSPLSLGQHRKTRRELGLARLRDEELRGFDWLVMGHWHQYLVGRGLIVNGSLKGYDEYAYVSNFEPEPPQQAFWIVTPEHGMSFSAPILVGDRAKEGW